MSGSVVVRPVANMFCPLFLKTMSWKLELRTISMLLTLSPRSKYGSPLFMSTEPFKTGLVFFMLRLDFRPRLVLIALKLRLLIGSYHSVPISIDTCERPVRDLHFLRLAIFFSLKRTKVFVAYLLCPALVVLVMNPLLGAARIDSSDLRDFLDLMRLLENLMETTDRADHLLDVSSKSPCEECGVLATFTLVPRFTYLLTFN